VCVSSHCTIVIKATLQFLSFVCVDYEPSNFIGGGSAPSFHHSPHHYPEPPEPIIEIIIQDNNETLPEPQPIVLSGGKKKKEQVQVFYVKYHKDEKKGLVIHEPVAALSPSGHEQHDEEEIHDEPIIVTPVPNIPKRATTLRTIIRPESEQYESNSGVHVTFNHPHNHHSKSDNHLHHDEVKVESAIQPVIQLPQSRIGPLPVVPLPKEKRAPQLPPPAHITQGRVVNSPPQQSNFHLPPQSLVQNLPYQRPHVDFNQQNNFVSHHGILSNQLTLPSQDSSKPFHPNQPFNPNLHHHQQFSQQNIRPQQPQPIPINHQNQFNQQQGILGHPQFNQPPRALPPPTHLQQQSTHLKPPQKPPVSANFNQNQRPFNYHAHQNQNQNQISQNRFQQQQSQQTLQRPQQIAPPRPQHNFQQQQQLPPLNRPPIQFNASPQFPPNSQQFPPHQGPPVNFKPEIKSTQPVAHAQPLHQHNQFAAQQEDARFHHQQPNNIFQGGLVEQAAPNLAGSRPPQFHQAQQQQAQHHHQPTFHSQEDARFHHQQQNFIQQSFGTDVQVSSSVPKFEHHITETVNAPVFFNPTAVDMERIQHEKNIGPLVGNIGHLNVAQQPKIIAPESQHRFAVNQQQHGSVSNHFSQVFPQIDNRQQQQQQFTTQSFAELNGRNNHNHFITESRAPSSTSVTPSTTPVSTTVRKVVSSTTTTAEPQTSTTKKPPAYFDLPDEIPDDLRKQLEESGVLENAHISILDYDKIGDTSLQDLPAEHLANFFNAGKYLIPLPNFKQSTITSRSFTQFPLRWRSSNWRIEQGYFGIEAQRRECR
jgi:kinesin family protein 13